MAIDGRINVDVLFHDTDGTTSLKVVSLEDSTAYTTGKVAIVTGTCGTTNVTIATSPSVFRDASGAIVDFDTNEGIIRRFAFSATGSLAYCENQAGARTFSTGGRVSVNDAGDMQAGEVFAVRTYSSGTAAWTLVIYGT
jgi:hypothetical protein